MLSIKPVKISVQGLLLLIALHGGFRATAFVTPSSTCQSARFSSHQHPFARELSPVPSSGICSQLPKPAAMATSQAALFGRRQQGEETSNNNPLARLRKLLRFRAWYTALSRSSRRVKRAAMLVMASAMIWFGTAGSYTPPASASSAVMERLLPSSNEQIIDRYVKQHMFDDDDATSSDPLEAAYREAYEDYKTSGAHPRALKEVTTEVLGQGAGKQLMKSDEEESLGFFGVIKGAVKLLERRAGLSETAALTVAAVALVVTIPTSTLLLGTVVSGMSRRSMDRLMKKRYGDTYTLDATIKEEPDVEAPDDDDDDDSDDE